MTAEFAQPISIRAGKGFSRKMALGVSGGRQTTESEEQQEHRAGGLKM